MTDNDNISDARTNLETARADLFEAYLSRINECYQSSDPIEREFILRGLDGFVDSIEDGRFIGAAANSLARKSARTISNYNPKEARKNREALGLTRRMLAEDLGLGRSGEILIYRYETGRSTPKGIPVSKGGKAYSEWLKKQT